MSGWSNVTPAGTVFLKYLKNYKRNKFKNVRNNYRSYTTAEL